MCKECESVNMSVCVCAQPVQPNPEIIVSEVYVDMIYVVVRVLSACARKPFC